MQPPFQQTPKKSPEDTRNMILAIALSMAIFVLWQVFYVSPQLEQQALEEQQRQEQLAEQEAILEAGGEAAAEFLETRVALEPEAALEQSGQRIAVSTDTLAGSIALQGGRIDELLLKNYRQSLDADSDAVELLWPHRSTLAYYPVFGWAAKGAASPGNQTPWTLHPDSPKTLTTEQPIQLVWENGAGLRFIREIAIDDRYMFTVTQRVENNTDQSVLVKPYAQIRQYGGLESRDASSEGGNAQTAAASNWLIHRGPIAAMDGTLNEPDYEDLEESEIKTPTGGVGVSYTVDQIGWLGFTDKYWMTALAPVEKTAFSQYFEFGKIQDQKVYRAAIDRQKHQLAPGAQYEVQTRFFAGAKDLATLRHYQYMIDGTEEPTNIFGKTVDFFFGSTESRFLDSIDWGWFFFFTKPISEVLLTINSLVGNMGVAIILLTVLFKIALFPLAYKSYVSMSKMKKIQPKIKEIQENAGDDKLKMQQEVMALYRKEKVNPAAGCLPIIIQMPIFFSLYKVIFISLELRHAPFFGWIQDLSAPDPTTLFNLFGLLPYDVPQILMIGVFPLIMGVSMWIQQMLNPAPTDPIQEKIFAFLPLLFTFLMAGFASGLVIYWCANNILTIIQQYSIMRSQGVEVNILDNMRRQFGLKQKANTG